MNVLLPPRCARTGSPDGSGCPFTAKKRGIFARCEKATGRELGTPARSLSAACESFGTRGLAHRLHGGFALRQTQAISQGAGLLPRDLGAGEEATTFRVSNVSLSSANHVVTKRLGQQTEEGEHGANSPLETCWDERT